MFLTATSKNITIVTDEPELRYTAISSYEGSNNIKPPNNFTISMMYKNGAISCGDDPKRTKRMNPCNIKTLASGFVYCNSNTFVNFDLWHHFQLNSISCVKTPCAHIMKDYDIYINHPRTKRDVQNIYGLQTIYIGISMKQFKKNFNLNTIL